MNRLRYIFFVLAAVVALCSCEDKTGSSSTLTVTPDTLRFTVDGGSLSFEVNSNSEWSITTEEQNTVVQPRTGGAGTTSVRVAVAPTTSTLQKHFILVVQTNDGSVVRNVRVEQEGQLAADDALLVSNHSNYILFSGNAGDMDSLMIRSTVAWDIYGPEWLEVLSSGGRFTPLSPTVPVRGTGIVTVPIRTRAVNREEYDLEEKIVIQESLTGRLKVELTAQQLGWHRAAPNSVLLLNTSLATDWKCGAGVSQFYCHLDTRDHQDVSNINIDDWEVLEPGDLFSWKNLNPGTVYYIGTIGLDAAGNYFSVHDMGFQTTNDMNPALALVNNLQHDGTQWTWTVTPNAQTNLYFVWSTTEFLKYSDGLMAWLFNYLLHGNYGLEEKYQTTNWRLQAQQDMQVLTWGVPPQSNVPAGVITRAFGRLSENVKATTPWTAATGPTTDRAKLGDLTRERVIKVKQ